MLSLVRAGTKVKTLCVAKMDDGIGSRIVDVGIGDPGRLFIVFFRIQDNRLSHDETI